MNTILMFLSEGLLALGPWSLVLITLALTHVTIVSVTVYLHRYSAHRALELNPVLKHFFRFWLWLTTGMNTRAWTAIHRKHHAHCDSEEDPHSPQVLGIRKVLREGAELYQAEALNQETLDKYGAGCPDDWIERNVYSRFPMLGIVLMALTNVVLFGFAGVTIWAVQMMWIPLFAAGVINGIGHYWGYRNFECKDASRNILPWGILIGGEELHNNHHTYPSSAKLSVRRFEFDMGWAWIRLFEMLGLAKVKKLAPKPVLATARPSVDLDTLRALVQHRFQVMAHYRRTVIKPVFQQERARACETTRGFYRRARALLYRDQRFFKPRHQQRLERLTEHNHTLATIYEYRLRLQEIWGQTSRNSAEMLDALKQWCREAEESGIHALQDFVTALKGYQPQPARA
ncbi:DesA family fatty acid desaturase [Alloalcanivorax xenomutans]|uniref:DesA family fatty acid desaturase n=1 Tax=Alloalcanivorax xenomutans TaxID=1094342 RepID=UPI00292E4FF7|nr:fatty acid desaturase [Alloalcanivorax xenomutans]WOA31698.1 fatty acid desaturase [Alloalcanivorax xenomutans]